MKRNTSIIFGEHFDTFIQNQIETGRYIYTSEVVRAGLRLLQQEEDKLKMLRQALAEMSKVALLKTLILKSLRNRSNAALCLYD